MVSGLGAAAGGVGQVYSDSSQGHLTSARNLGGAMAGGALQAQLALRGRPMLAGAAGGATTAMLQDALNGRSISVGTAAEAAGAGATLGKLGDIIGRRRFYLGGSQDPKRPGEWVELGNFAKGERGEEFSSLRTLLNFDLTRKGPKQRLYLNTGDYTVPDQVTGRGQYVESKAGPFARLSRLQRRAMEQLGGNFRVDHFLPQDNGALFGFLGSQIGYQLPDYDRPDQNPQVQQGQ